MDTTNHCPNCERLAALKQELSACYSVLHECHERYASGCYVWPEQFIDRLYDRLRETSAVLHSMGIGELYCDDPESPTPPEGTP